jgi:hypothetical protein
MLLTLLSGQEYVLGRNTNREKNHLLKVAEVERGGPAYELLLSQRG